MAVGDAPQRVRSGLARKAWLAPVGLVVLAASGLLGVSAAALDGTPQQQRAALATVHLLGWLLTAIVVAGAVRMRRFERGRAERRARERAAAQRVRAQNVDLARALETDALTGLLNRQAFLARLDDALVQSRRAGTKLAVAYLDIDRFKLINDTRGHPVGDDLLVAVAARLRAVWPEPAVVARLGGDEFVLLLDPVHEPEIVAAADALARVFTEPFDLDGVTQVVRASIGLAVAPHDGYATADLLRHADMAMYEAKRARSDWVRFTPRLGEEGTERVLVEANLRFALAHDELRLHYQPLVDLRDGRVAAVEALVRWEHPELGLVHPADFIPIAEESDLILQIGDWVLAEAARQAAAWARAGQALRLCVNVSPAQLSRPGLAQRVAALCAEHGLAPARLGIEVTEHAVMEHGAHAVAELRALRALGVEISLDDFGVGYSSLARLGELPVDILKIDRSFVHGALTVKNRLVGVRAATELGHGLGLRVVAEGVETTADLDAVAGAGCDLAQGYYFARPVSAHECTALLAGWDRAAAA
jgi:diguanylate cyclase (GGDEF)-like protein